MHQDHIQFSAPKSGRECASREDADSPRVAMGRRVPAIRAKGQSYGDAESCARTQNKVLVIMDYQIFRKQVYRGTGSQRDSMEGVMDSVQIRPAKFLISSSEQRQGYWPRLTETVTWMVRRSERDGDRADLR